MAKFKIFKDLKSKIKNLPIKEGQLIFTTDEPGIYLDNSPSDRISLVPQSIDELKGNIEASKINGSVANAVHANSADISNDVHEWAKASTKPTYTAKEVGALPESTIIPKKTSELTNDNGFLTEHQDISGKLDKNQGSVNNGKILGIDSQGNITPIVASLSSTNGELKEIVPWTEVTFTEPTSIIRWKLPNYNHNNFCLEIKCETQDSIPSTFLYLGYPGDGAQILITGNRKQTEGHFKGVMLKDIFQNNEKRILMSIRSSYSWYNHDSVYGTENKMVWLKEPSNYEYASIWFWDNDNNVEVKTTGKYKWRLFSGE